MAIVLALISALSYGTSDFLAGVASRRWAAEPVAGLAVTVGLFGAGAGVLLFGGHGPDPHALEWGAVSGLGTGIGTLSLYRGFARASMTVVATLSGVLAAIVPVLVGLALGNHLSPIAAAGIVIAIPAIGLVSWQPGGDRAGIGPGLAYGALAGIGFGLLFVALDRAGTRAGAWPTLPGQAVGLSIVAPVALRHIRAAGRVGGVRLRDGAIIVGAGLLGCAAALLFLAASGHGELAVVGVLASMYPAFTILLARAVLRERWSRSQALGLLVAAASVVLVSLG
jgi:drug/metabolite transporter (DMT)-like permease